MKKLKPSFVAKIKNVKPVASYDPSIPPDISFWFKLSYAHYLTVPRLVLESMPLEWQHKMAALLFEMDKTFDWRPKEGRYWVRLKDSNGRFTAAPLSDYRRGHAEIEKLRIKPTDKIDPSKMQWSKKDIARIKKLHRKPLSFNKIMKTCSCGEPIDPMVPGQDKCSQCLVKPLKKHWSFKPAPVKYNILVKKYHAKIAKEMENISRISDAMRGHNEIRGI